MTVAGGAQKSVLFTHAPEVHSQIADIGPKLVSTPQIASVWKNDSAQMLPSFVAMMSSTFAIEVASSMASVSPVAMDCFVFVES